LKDISLIKEDQRIILMNGRE